MVKRCIGIDVGSSHLCAVQVLRIGKTFCIEKIFDTQARRGTDSASDTLKALVSKHGFDRRAAVAISVPNDAVFFRGLETDSVGLEQVRGRGYSALDHDFPIEADEIVAQPCSYHRMTDQKYSILTAAVSRESLRQTREILLGARMHPDLIGAAVFSIHSAITLNHPEIRTGAAIIACIAESHLTLAVTRNNVILLVRHFPIVSGSGSNGHPFEDQVGQVLSREAGITWRKLFETEIAQDTKVYLVAASENIAGLKEAIEENLHCRTIVVNPYARVLLKHVGRPRVDISVAEGLALRMLAPEYTSGINFLEADGVNAKSATSFRKELSICAVLVAAIAAVSLIGLFMRVSQLEAKYARVKSEIRESFQTALPQEKNIVNPLAQLGQELQSLKQDYELFGPVSGAGPLEVLRAVTANTPADMNISFDDMLITAESVRLTGTSESFESVYNWQRLLQDAPQFSRVDVGNPQREPGGELIRFTVLASFVARDQE
ncbi:MAG: hypothetical protein ISS70_24860 [Phycisphaerae bacterium]|nr:hypothetical protein [Phycisphaerae bacterium]